MGCWSVNRRTGVAPQDCANHSLRATGDSAKLRLMGSDDLRVKRLKQDSSAQALSRLFYLRLCRSGPSRLQRMVGGAPR